MNAMSAHVNARGLFCLVPVRNGSQYLDAFLACMDRIDAQVIALDDGSTDDTRKRLLAHARVSCLLTNPVRPDFTGWNDAENRARLLAACADFPVRWVLWLDIDELLPHGDDTRLLAFLDTKARADRAYGLEVLRMIGDSEHFDRCHLWVYRLFAYRIGLTLPSDRLHFEPVPREIAEQSWQRTRLRIMHFSSVDETARALRYRKYQEVDPECEWQADYEDILDGPGHLWRLRPLPEDKDLLLD
jgi:hypothetical protein